MILEQQSRRAIAARGEREGLHRALWHCVEERAQLLRIELRLCGGAVAARLLAGRDQESWPFLIRFSAASVRPVSGGLRSSSAALMHSTAP